MTIKSRLGARALVTVVLACAAPILAACATNSANDATTPPAPSASAPSSDAASSAPESPAASASATATKATPKPKPVHITSLESDGATYGIGMPIILRFSKLPKTSVDFVKATKVTVNGQAVKGAWFWEKPMKDGLWEAHYRMQAFWPGHATIKVTLPKAGTSAGPGLAFDGQLASVTFHTGPATIGRVDGVTSKLTVTSDGKLFGVFPVALGASNTPTLVGTKVIMAKGRNEPMVGSGYSIVVPWSMRLTIGGEYLHAASWNVPNILAGRPSSNGCTNLLPADAEKLFNFMEIGDPVIYATNMPGINVKLMPSWDGYGDWNLNWPTWSAGGELRNH
ncbi:MAG: L,D-transpeptidase [Actinomycetia bacterium]|nr:L,D-transpeptidase [Actinomycetes bacterium]